MSVPVYTSANLSESESAIAYSTNAVGAGALSKAVAKLDIPVVQVSTDYIFDGSLDRPYRELDTPRPLGIFGPNKLSAELTVAQVNSDYVILRASLAYSRFGKDFIRTTLTLA